MQAFNFCSVSYLKCFGTSLLQFEIVKLYKSKVKLSEEQALFYSLAGAIINNQKTLAIFFAVLLI